MLAIRALGRVSWRMWRICLRVLVAAVGCATLLALVMAEVSPSGIHSNISEWLTLAGDHHVPRWLLAKGADQTVVIASVVLFVLNIFVLVVSFAEPKAREKKRGPHMTPYQAIHYLADETKWGYGLRSRPLVGVEGGRETMTWRKPLLEAFAEFADKAQRNGIAISVRGRLNGAGEHVQIHPSFWASHTFDMLSDDLTPYARLGTMITKADGDRTWAYTDLEIEPAGVMKT